MTQAAWITRRRWGGGADGTAATDATDTANPADAEDRRLLRAGSEGDRAALAALLGRHEADLLRVCRSLLPVPADAEDAVQEAFLRALRAIDGVRGAAAFRGDASVRTWLFRIAVNVCLEWRRRRANDAASLDGPDGEEVLAAGGPSPEERAVARLTVRAALLSLPARSRALLVLREQEQWGCAEIGALLGWNEKKVQNELAKARRALARWREEERL